MTQVSIYSNGSQECERASSLLRAVHLDEVEYPMISIGMFRGTLKETMNYMSNKGMFV